MMQSVEQFFCSRAGRKKDSSMEKVSEMVRKSLELGYFPRPFFSYMERQGLGSADSLRQCAHRAAPELWERGTGYFHSPACRYEKPLTVLQELVHYLSGGKIL